MDPTPEPKPTRAEILDAGNTAAVEILRQRHRAALADLDHIPALHQRGVSHPDECGTCNELYPCGTVQATIRIRRTLTGQETT